jgi:DEAD/DEAH box helicase domain-containing protein
MVFDPKAFLAELQHQRGYSNQLVYAHLMPARAPRYAPLKQRLSRPVAAALRAGGVERLYTHQAEAISAALAGENVVVATSTASGKTLCFNVPVMEALARDPLARALYLYPTKALAQDQLGKWQSLLAAAQAASPADGALANAEAATYDGDTPQAARARIRKRARVLITNPDMLHVGILPNHPLWAEFFRHLKYVIIDEAHSYRGVFGSQVACVLRRLRRVCALYQGVATESGEPGARPLRNLLPGRRRSRAASGRARPGGSSTYALRLPGPLRRNAVPASAGAGEAGDQEARQRGEDAGSIGRAGSLPGAARPAQGSEEPSSAGPWPASPQPAGPHFIATSATIANPGEHFSLLTGLPVTVITDDGSPHGTRVFALWNPPFLDRALAARRSANREAADLFTALVTSGVRTIAFTRARVVAELLLRYTRDQLKRSAPDLMDKVAAYRAGYMPAERRRIERELFQGRLRGVTATNALELGIDVGGLDASLLVGYPSTIASLWQQAGRAGRGDAPSLAILIGLDNPLDQYYMRHPADLFGRPHEHALIDPDNVYVLQRHLPCAAHEAPLTVPVRDDGERTYDDERGAGADDQLAGGWNDEALFGPGFVEAMVGLEDSGVLRYLAPIGEEGEQRWVYTRSDYPAQDVSLRDAEGERFAVLNAADGYKMIEELDASSAPFRVHPGAVYLHQGESFLVTEYNHDMRHAIVTPAEGDYYTQPRELSDVRIIRSLRHRQMANTSAYLGQVRARSQVIGYRRIQQFSEAVLGDEPLDMPGTEFTTIALWWDLPPEMPADLAERGLDFLGGIHAAEHACIGILPLFAMCDRWDIGGLSTPRHPDTDGAQIFIYDGFPGGVGIAEKGFELLPELWSATLELVQGCPCTDGCPSCVQSPKCGNFNHPLDKQAAILILRWLLGR